MARKLVIIGMLLLGSVCACLTSAPVAAKRDSPRRKPAAKVKPAPPRQAAPGAVDEKSLGFGSTREDVERLMGKPTRVVKVEKREIWFYGLSTISLAQGKKVVAWSKYDRPLPVNVGTAKPNPPAVLLGSSMETVIAAYGTPTTVAVQGQHQVWFFGTRSYAIRGGKVVPEQMAAPVTNKAPVQVANSTASASPRQRCWCPL